MSVVVMANGICSINKMRWKCQQTVWNDYHLHLILYCVENDSWNNKPVKCQLILHKTFDKLFIKQ